jgi:hypothetical protein
MRYNVEYAVTVTAVSYSIIAIATATIVLYKDSKVDATTDSWTSYDSLVFDLEKYKSISLNLLDY